MDRNRIGTLALIAGALITLAASAFAVGAAVTSDDDGVTAGGGDTTAPAAVAGSEPAGTAAAPPGTAVAGSAPAAPATATARFDIEIASFRFSPQDAVVAVGTEVVWTNNDSEPHSIVSSGDQFTSSEPFGNGESYSVVFTTPGTYEYICGVHPSMTGTITVEA